MFGGRLRCDTCNRYKPDRCICSKPGAAKGDLGGECFRRVCSTPGARYFNSSTRRHYCWRCARLINELNPESVLCTLVEEEGASGAKQEVGAAIGGDI